MIYKKYEVIGSVRLNKYPKYDAFLFDRVGDIRQNNWTMKYRCSDLQKYEVTRSVKLNKYPKNDAYLLDRERARDIRQITGPCNIGHGQMWIMH